MIYNVFIRIILAFIAGGFTFLSHAQQPGQVRGWNILSESYEDDLITLAAAKSYNINHLQLSHNLVMDLQDLRKPDCQKRINDLIDRAHMEDIKEVVVWDHALYNLNYYPAKFRTGPNGTIDLDNPEFMKWFKQDYRDMMNLVPEVNGLVLTFIETGARAENQYSEKMKTGAEKLASVVDAVASVVCDELGKKLYIRTFAYTDAEYKTIIGCIGHIRSNKIILMMKETPHDFFLTHPNDKYAGTIDRPTIIEFDAGNEFNGQGVIADTWPEYIIRRWSDLIRRPHVIGYVARTDRYGDTRLAGTPNEILLYALKRFTEDNSVTSETIYEEFISQKYGNDAIPYLKPAFKLAYDIVTSSLYTLGTNISNHSRMDFDPYKSSYGRHVSGKWLDPPVVFIKHDINKEFHYWKDVIEHLAPPQMKKADAALKTEAPFVLENGWVTPEEKMDETFLKYIITEKKYGVKCAEEALRMVASGEKAIKSNDYHLIYNLFYRTLLTARIYEATATSYFGYRVFARGESFQTPWLKETLTSSLDSMMSIAARIEDYNEKVPHGQWNWKDDATTARDYYKIITETGWKDYGNVVFRMNYDQHKKK